MKENLKYTKIKYLAFDGDDTLWANEYIYKQYDTLVESFLKKKNMITEEYYNHHKIILPQMVKLFGFGFKVYILSVLETISNVYPDIMGKDIKEFMDITQKFYKQIPVRVFLGVENILHALKKDYVLMLITKGDLWEQEYKIEHSNLKRYFKYIHIVREKTPATYKDIIDNLNINPKEFIMIGNSFESDIKPVVEIGAKAIYIQTETNQMLEASPSKKQLNNKHITTIVSLNELLTILQ